LVSIKKKANREIDRNDDKMEKPELHIYEDKGTTFTGKS
jgi:hypothetical protein